MARNRKPMKKLTLILLSIVMIVTLTACGDKKCDHVYDDCADIECNECGEKRDSMHTWIDADCDTPKTCKVCGATDGEALGHSWKDANCLTPKTCKVCEKTEGEALGHTVEEDDGDCTTPILCTVCDSVVTAAKTHDFSGEWQKFDNGHYHVCQNVGCTIEDTKIAHSGGEATCSGVYCEVCGYKYDTATNPDKHEVSLIDKDGKCLCGEIFAAAIGRAGYYTFEDALSNWTDGTTLTLLADITHPNSITVSNKSVTIDLNGHSYSLDGTAFNISSSASLTIIDTSADKSGSITQLSEKSEPTIWVEGTLNILGGRISSYAQLIPTIYVNDGGKFTMSGGTVEQPGNSYAMLLWENTASVISGGVIADEIHSYGRLTIKDQAMITSEKSIYWIRGAIDLSQAKKAEGWTITVWRDPMIVGVNIILPEGMELQVDNVTTNAAEKDVITTIRHPHVGGTANCTNKAICDICSEPYGTFIHAEEQSCKINETDHNKHDYYYPCCGALANTEVHSFVDNKCVCGMEIEECGFELATEGKLVYFTGEELDFSDFSFNLLFSNGDSKTLTIDDVIIDDSDVDTAESGTYTVAFSYKDFELITFDVIVYAVERLELSFYTIERLEDDAEGNPIYHKNSFKTLYSVGEELDTNGLSVYAVIMYDGESQRIEVSDYEIIGFDSSEKTQCTLIISALGAEVMTTVHITDVAPTPDENGVYQMLVDPAYLSFIADLSGPFHVFNTIQQALDYCEQIDKDAMKTITVAPGTYNEKLEITIPNLSIVGVGETLDDVIITFDDVADRSEPNGFVHVLDSTATVTVRESAYNVKIENLTISNPNDIDESDGALTLFVQSEGFVFEGA